MRIVVAPALVGDRLCRIVAPIPTLLEVEEWVGAWWDPSTVMLTAVSQSAPATEQELRERGVPAEDCVTAESAEPSPDLQTQLRAHAPAPRLGPVDAGASIVPHGVRAREYTGNKNFRRARPGGTASGAERTALKHDAPGAAARGHKRRATDADDPNEPRSLSI